MLKTPKHQKPANLEFFKRPPSASLKRLVRSCRRSPIIKSNRRLQKPASNGGHEGHLSAAALALPGQRREGILSQSFPAPFSSAETRQRQRRVSGASGQLTGPGLGLRACCCSEEPCISNMGLPATSVQCLWSPTTALASAVSTATGTASASTTASATASATAGAAGTASTASATATASATGSASASSSATAVAGALASASPPAGSCSLNPSYFFSLKPSQDSEK